MAEQIAGPVIVRNTSEMRRVWPDLSTINGHTLDLEPGAEDILAQDPGEVQHLKVRPVRPPAPVTPVDPPEVVAQ